MREHAGQVLVVVPGVKTEAAGIEKIDEGGGPVGTQGVLEALGTGGGEEAKRVGVLEKMEL